jgi:hypothetical protein
MMRIAAAPEGRAQRESATFFQFLIFPQGLWNASVRSKLNALTIGIGVRAKG